MNLKIFLAFSLILNLALGIYVIRKPAGSHSLAQASEAGPAAELAAVPVTIPGETVTNTLVRKITWQMVESPDYREYINNLRAIGCPDETIRDIIVADVNKLYDQKKKEVRGEPRRYEFWKPGNPFFSSVDGEVMSKIRALDEEKNDVLRALGIEPDFKTQAAQAFNPFEAMMDFLPEQKKVQVMKVFMDMQSRMAKLMEDGGRPDMAEMAKAQKDMEQSIRQMLTPEEAIEFDLRFSNTANQLRSQLAGFDPGEEEFMTVFKLRKAFDDEFNPMLRGQENEQERKQREEAQKQLDDALRQALGDTRFQDYKRAQEYDFQQMQTAARRAGLTTDTAVQMHEMKKAAEQQARELRNNRDLPSEQRNELLSAIQQETERSFQQALGEKGWEEYNRGHNTQWLKNLAPPSPPRSADP
jgi:hypothetical protein